MCLILPLAYLTAGLDKMPAELYRIARLTFIMQKRSKRSVNEEKIDSVLSIGSVWRSTDALEISYYI